MSTTSANLRLVWQRIGQVETGANGRLLFPAFGAFPRVYKFSVRKSDGSRAEYIGESKDVKRRFQHYRTPGPTQPTNLRLNALFKEILFTRGTIEVEVIDKAWIILNGNEIKADFYSKSVRRLFENFVLTEAFLTSVPAFEIERLNK